MKRSNRTVQYLVAFAISLAGIMAGVSVSWTSTIIPKFYDNQTGFELTDAEISWMAAINSPGFVTGSLASRFVSDSMGRRATVLGSALPFVIGTIIIISTSNIWLICITKYLWGIGTGMTSTVSTIYLAEIADKEIRGSISVSYRFIFNLGSFLMMAIGPFISYDTINYIFLGLPLTYFVACCFVPETPYFYLKEGKVDQARKVLTMLKGNINDDKVLEEELTTMRAAVKKDMSRSGSIKELLTGIQYRKAVIITFGLKMAQLLTGTLVLQQYLGAIIKESNSTMKLETVFITFGASRFIVGVLSSVIADKVGRRPLLLYSYLGTSLSLTMVAVYFFCQEILQIEKHILSSYSVTVFIGIMLTNIISTLGYNFIIYAVVGEVFPLNVKSVAVSSLSMIGGISSFFVTKMYQTWKDLTGLFGVFTFCSAVSFLAVIFVYFLVPETRGKSLVEIQVMLQGDRYNDTDDAIGKDNSGTQDVTELKPMISKLS